MILVTGAAGKTGIAVIRTLIDRGARIRALVHRPDQTGELKAIGVKETIIGDMRDDKLVRTAVDGVRAIYHIPPNVHPDEFEIGRLMIDTAVVAGVERFVYHSVLHPQTEAMPHHWKKLRVEEHLLAASLPFTILQPAVYMQNVLGYWDTIIDEGIFGVPYAVDTRLSMVDLDDIAAVAAMVLIDEGHDGATYELVGTEPLTQQEVATIVSRQLGTSVRAELVPREEWEETARAAGTLGDYAVNSLLQMFRYYEEHGFYGNPNVLRWLLGHEPTAFETFVDRVVEQRGRPRG